MHLVPLPLWGQGHGDAGALTGSTIQITEALQAGRKRLRSCQWTVNTGGLISSVHCDRSAVCPSGRAPRSFSLRAANRCIDLDPQWSPGEGGSPSHTLGPGREETAAFSHHEFLKLLARFVGSSTTDTTCSTTVVRSTLLPIQLHTSPKGEIRRVTTIWSVDTFFDIFVILNLLNIINVSCGQDLYTKTILQ